MDHLCIWVGRKDQVDVSLSIQGFIAPARLSQSLRVVLFQQREQAGLAWLALPELPPDALRVGLEFEQPFIAQHCGQTALEVRWFA